MSYVRTRLAKGSSLALADFVLIILNGNRTTRRITLRAPVMLMVLAATAIPVESRPPRLASLDMHINAADVVANLGGYVPVGMVLADTGLL
jgi:hypothetical protein